MSYKNPSTVPPSISWRTHSQSLVRFSINPSMKSIALSLAFVSAVAAQRTFNVFNNWCVVSQLLFCQSTLNSLARSPSGASNFLDISFLK
jgi:hypothetical protein